MTTYINYMPKPQKNKKNLHTNTCSKSNSCISNATTPTWNLLLKNIYLNFFPQTNNVSNPSQKK
jgi:hypothetical protein